MKKKSLNPILLLVLVLSLILGGCQSLTDPKPKELLASGTIAAKDVKISSELGGKVLEIAAREGDEVARGDILFRIDDQLLQVQYNQAQAAVEVAQAAVYAAEAQLASTRLQFELTLQSARFEEIEIRNQSWLTSQLEEIDLPVWYFEKQERISALEAEVEDMERYLEIQLENLDDELQDASNGDFIETEKELAQLQEAFNIAAITLQQAEAANDDTLIDVAQETSDAILAELESVKLEYDRLLSTTAAENILQARAEAAVARAQLANTRDQLMMILQGEESLQVEAALAGVEQAKTAVVQAEASLAQASAALELLEIQIEKAAVYSPMDGVVLSRNLEIGETVTPAAVVMVIGKLDEVELVVYIPETEYGNIYLEQEVSIQVDSFPGESFTGEVVYISDQAEFTPRNVQTVEGRQATVYAVRLAVPNPEGNLKPGMPADVSFQDD
jgi:HlyD family secretion protein